MKNRFLMSLLLIIALHAPVLAAPFVDNGNGTVNDVGTGLIWQQEDDNTPRSWQGALDYCNTLSLGGNGNWRLPNIKELRSIVDETRFNPAIDPIFSGTDTTNYWSASFVVYNPSVAWGVGFDFGTVGGYLKVYDYYVRCVR